MAGPNESSWQVLFQFVCSVLCRNVPSPRNTGAGPVDVEDCGGGEKGGDKENPAS